MANARAKAEAADQASEKALKDSDIARLRAKEFAPEFLQPGTDVLKKQLDNNEIEYDFSQVQGLGNHQPHRSKSLNTQSPHHSNFEGLDPTGMSTLNALKNEVGGQHRMMANDYGHHQQLLNVGGNFGSGGNQRQPDNSHLPSRSPSLKVRRYSFLAGSRRGRGFSEIFNSTILNDHFDQYTAADSGIGGDGLGTSEGNTTSTNGHNAHSQSNHNPRLRQPPANPSPDSGVSDSMDDEYSKNRSLQRRRTMPCIVDDADSNKTKEMTAAKQQMSERETAHSSENLNNKNPDKFIIENGIRKRIQAEVHMQPNRDQGQLPKEYKILDNRLNAAGGMTVDKRGSLPDLKNATTIKPMSRREAYELGTARRAEIRRLQDLAERRRQGDMSVILGDVRDWCQERQLLVLVIALNLSLATMFFNFLS